MCKYVIDPMSIVEDTERTRFCPQTDRRTDRQTDKVIPVYPPFNFVEVGGIITHDKHKYIELARSSKTKYVDGTPTSEVTPVTIRYIHPPHHGHPKVTVMVMND